MSFKLSKLTTRIGRDASNDIILPNDSKVSRYHAEIRREGNSYVLHDLNSKNGTRVNDHHITQHILTDGDRIRVGSNDILYRAGTLLLPGDALTGHSRAGAGQSSNLAVIVAVVGLLLVVMVGIGLTLPHPSPPATVTPVPGSATADSIARRWVHSHSDRVADQITDEISWRIPLESPVLRDKVREQIVSDNNWTYSPPVKITEEIYRVRAKTTFVIGMVDQPDYSVTASYILTVDTGSQQVKEYYLEEVDVHKI